MQFQFPIGEWMGLIIFIGMILLILRNFVAYFKAKKKVKQGVLYGGLEYLIYALKDENKDVQDNAIEALGKTKDPRAVEALIAFVNSPAIRDEEDGYMLARGLNALGEIEDPKAVDFLIATLGDKDWVVRCYACPPLANLARMRGIKDFRAVEPLIALLKDIKDRKKRKDSRYDSIFEEWAEEALKAITGEHFGADHEKWKKWWEENKKSTQVVEGSKKRDSGSGSA